MQPLPAHEERVRKGHARKDRKRWCKGKPGVEHVPEVVIPPNAMRPECREYGMRTRDGEPERWWACGHVLACANCGKVLKFTVRCPKKPRGLRQLWLPASEW